MKCNLLFSLCVISIFISSCASSYFPIDAMNLTYTASYSEKDVLFEYDFNALRESGNVKYARQAVKNKIDLIGVKVINNSKSTISFKDDVLIYDGDIPTVPLEAVSVKDQIRQPAEGYLLYALAWGFIQECEDDDCSTIPLPIGLPFAIINITVASTANKKLLIELENNSIIDKVIAPGETVYGLLAIQESKNRNLKFEIKEQ
ncbi:MAG: hypothetical protein CMO01_05165 [Thalassobius sp.]|nr:hypothetical protein [Thalassovita sp.]